MYKPLRLLRICMHINQNRSSGSNAHAFICTSRHICQLAQSAGEMVCTTSREVASSWRSPLNQRTARCDQKLHTTAQQRSNALRLAQNSRSDPRLRSSLLYADFRLRMLAASAGAAATHAAVAGAGTRHNGAAGGATGRVAHIVQALHRIRCVVQSTIFGLIGRAL